MFKYHSTGNSAVIAELIDSNFIIKEAQDALDLLAGIEVEGCSRFIIYKENLSDAFFSLGSGLAGEILQKFSNYRVRLAVIGDFSAYKSKNLNDFFRESNRTGNILFVSNLQEALSRFSNKYYP